MASRISCNSDSSIWWTCLLPIAGVREIIGGTVAQVYIWAPQVLLYWTASSIGISRITNEHRVSRDAVDATRCHLKIGTINADERGCHAVSSSKQIHGTWSAETKVKVSRWCDTIDLLQFVYWHSKCATNLPERYSTGLQLLVKFKEAAVEQGFTGTPLRQESLLGKLHWCVESMYNPGRPIAQERHRDPSAGKGISLGFKFMV